MKRAKLLDLVLFSTAVLASGCGEDTAAPDVPAPDAGTMDSAPSASASATPAPPVTTTQASTTTPAPSTAATAQPTATATSSATSMNTGGAGGTPPVSTGGAGPMASGGAGGMSGIPECEPVVSFDAAWGLVATGGGTSPTEWETSVVPTIADGVFNVEVPFASSGQQFGWNGDYPDGPVDCAGRELVARIRLLSGFVEDPATSPGGVLMYLFSNEWANNVSAWSNVPAPSEDWFEASVGCAPGADEAFDPATVNGLGFTFNTGGADTTAYTATPATFEVDELCWRTTGAPPVGSGGAGGMGGMGGMGGTDGGAAGRGGAGGSSETSDGGTEGPLDGGSEDTELDGGQSTSTGEITLDGGSTESSTNSSDEETSTSESSAQDASTIPDCEMLVEFSAPWGVVATDGGTDPEEWEIEVEPTISGGVFSVEVPFESAVQQFGWVGDHPGGTVDCTGWELVARVRLLSGFVENPQTMGGGVQVYLFSDAWGASRNDWNVVPAPSEQWFEATVDCATLQNSDFDPSDVNGVGFTFNSGGEAPTDYDAEPAEFEVDHLCWRK